LGRKKREHLSPSQLLAEQDGARSVGSMCLEDVLRDIQPDCANLPHGRLLWWSFDTSTLAQQAVEGRPPHHLVSGRFPQKGWMMDESTNGEARPGEAERPQESGAASPGRGGRMSRQRKTAAVLRLLRGEDLETVSRSLGVTAATLSSWRDAFLAAGEAILTSKPASGEELESDRLKAKLGAALIERDLLHEKIALLEADRPLARRRRRP
jgi:transposase-like protein